jgi:hypothetical protein
MYVSPPECVHRNGSDVVPSFNVGPVSGKHSSPVLVLLALPDSSHSGSFKAKVQSSYAAECGAYAHGVG